MYFIESAYHHELELLFASLHSKLPANEYRIKSQALIPCFINSGRSNGCVMVRSVRGGAREAELQSVPVRVFRRERFILCLC